MRSLSERVGNGRELGAGRRAEALALGSAAMAPLVAAAFLVWLTAPDATVALVSASATWSGALVAFFAGVRRGLTFSERGGPTAAETVSMLSLFALAVVIILLRGGPAALSGAVAAFICVAWMDRRAARRFQAPPYLAAFRPVQMFVGSLALLILIARTLAH